MENKSILIQCDEMTKNMMGELQDDMISSLSKVSKSMSADVIEKIRPLEKKISDLKKEIDEFVEDNEEFHDIVEELNNNMDSITKTIETTIDASIMKVINEHSRMILEHNKLFNDNLHKLIDDTQSIKDNIKSSNQLVAEKLESLDAKIGDMTFEQLEDKLAILGIKLVKDSAKNKDSIIEKIENISTIEIEDKIHSLEQEIESNFFSNKQLLCEKTKSISDKIDEKDLLIKIIHGYENELSKRIDSIQEEVEWSNRSFFARIFGKKR